MLMDYISYSLTLIISAGMAVIGIMAAYQVYQQKKLPILSTLLYQQIFLFCFFMVGIWGNMALQGIVADLDLPVSLSARLGFYIPVIGIPFMMVSWFMLLKFAFNLNGYRLPKFLVWAYFPTFVGIVFTLTFLVQKKIIQIPTNADLFVVRIIVILNVLVHLIFLLPALRPKRKAPLIKEIGVDKKTAFVYLIFVVLYSVSLFFYPLYEPFTVCLAISLLFVGSVILPAKTWIYLNTQKTELNENMDFSAFCNFYEISKREAEIVLEICSGKSNKDISEKLFITLQTVKDHNHRIYTKTGVKSRVQLANLVREKTGET